MNNGASYYALLASLRQSELLGEAEQMRRLRDIAPRRRNRILSLILPRRRGRS
jgi:hypothetical protein